MISAIILDVDQWTRCLIDFGQNADALTEHSQLEGVPGSTKETRGIGKTGVQNELCIFEPNLEQSIDESLIELCVRKVYSTRWEFLNRDQGTPDLNGCSHSEDQRETTAI